MRSPLHHWLQTIVLATASAEDDLRTYGDFIGVRLPAFAELYAVPSSRVWSTGTDQRWTTGPPPPLHFPCGSTTACLRLGTSQWLTVEGGRTLCRCARDPARRCALPRPRAASCASEDSVRSWTRPASRPTTGSSSPPLGHGPQPGSPMPHHWKRTSSEPLVTRDNEQCSTRTSRAATTRVEFALVELSRADVPALVSAYRDLLDEQIVRVLPSKVPLLVTLNATDRIDPAKVIASMTYSYPVFRRRLRGTSVGSFTFRWAHRVRRPSSRLGVPRGRLPVWEWQRPKRWGCRGEPSRSNRFFG